MLASLLGCAGPPSGAVDYAVVGAGGADASAALGTRGTRFGEALAAADLDGDGADEILVGAWTPGAWVLDGESLVTRAKFAVAASDFSVGTDGVGPVLLVYAEWDTVSESSTFYRVDAGLDGAPASVVRLGSERVNDTALAALDGDEVDDLLIANRDGDDGIWAYAGVPGAYPDEEPRVRFGPAESSFLTVVGVDVDGDGVSEVLGGAWGADDPSTEDGEVGAVYVFDGGIEADVAAADARGVFYGTVHRTENGWMEESTGRRLDPGADLDGDGLPEVLVTGTTWLWAAPLGARGAHRLDEVALAVGAPGVQLGSDDDAGALYLWQASTLARL